MLKNAKAFSSFSTNDIGAAKKFYGETLGLDVATTPEGLELRIPNAVPIFIYEKPSHSPASFTVLNFMVENIDDTVSALKKAGVKFETYNEGMLKTDEHNIARSSEGPRAIAWFKDPAGNFLSVLQN